MTARSLQIRTRTAGVAVPSDGRRGEYGLAGCTSISVWVIAIVFGPKLGGAIDISVIAAVVAVAYYGLPIRGRWISTHRPLVLLSMATLGVALFAGMVSRDVELLVLARFVRGAIMTIALGLLGASWASRHRVRGSVVAGALLGAFTLNAIVVILQVAVRSTQPLFARIFLFSKGLGAGRGFGLTAGYDAAGFLCALGLLLCLLVLSRRRLLSLSLPATVAYAGCGATLMAAALLTSRSAMVLAAAAATYGALHLIRHRGLPARLGGALVLLGIAAIIYQKILPVVRSTVRFSSSALAEAVAENPSYTSKFAATSLDELVREMVFQPVPFPQSIVGAAREPAATDIGYIILLGMVGYLGLAMIIAYHFKMAIALQSARRLPAYRKQPWLRMLVIFSLVGLVLLFGMNIKGLYFGTRGLAAVLSLAFFYCIAAVQDDSGTSIAASEAPASREVGNRQPSA